MIRATDLKQFLATQNSVVQIVVTQVRGSAPRNSGTEMFVTATACLGTIGGGQLEYRAIRAASPTFPQIFVRELFILLGFCFFQTSHSFNFIYREKDTESEYRIQNINLEYKLQPK